MLITIISTHGTNAARTRIITAATSRPKSLSTSPPAAAAEPASESTTTMAGFIAIMMNSKLVSRDCQACSFGQIDAARAIGKNSTAT